MITYREDFGLHWPDYDDLAERTHAAVMKRKHHALAVLPYVKQRACVVQAGGHVGVWPLELAARFDRVWTFEPDEACYAALAKNVEFVPCIERRCAALREHGGVGHMITGKCSSWRFEWDGEDCDTLKAPAVAATTIDSLPLEACDAIVLDVEGSELAALRGAGDTIRRFWPVIQLEEWYDNRAEYMDFMRRLGYRPVTAAGADTVYAPDRRAWLGA